MGVAFAWLLLVLGPFVVAGPAMGYALDGAKADWDNAFEFDTLWEDATLSAVGAQVPLPVTINGRNGNAVTISSLGSTSSLSLYTQSEGDGAWRGSFTPGETLLATGLPFEHQGGLLLTFETPIEVVSGQVQSAAFGWFTASINGHDEAGEFVGQFVDYFLPSTLDADGSAPTFLVTAYDGRIKTLSMRFWQDVDYWRDHERTAGVAISSLYVVTPLPAALPMLAAAFGVLAAWHTLNRSRR